jgi:hypothetical protein
MGQPRRRCFLSSGRDPEIKKYWQEIEKERLWEDRRDWKPYVHQPVRNGNYIKKKIIQKCVQYK